ncbi:MAG TPA: hypothetical protein VGC45_00510 [Gryllotalpicola sp.]
MHVVGHLAEDAPDPALDVLEKARRMPVPVFGLVPQRHLEDWDALGVQSSTSNGVFDSCAVSIGYTLWRRPDNIDDPVNLAELDERTRRSLDREPSWPRPSWLLDRVRRMRYPMLWECVSTHWSRTPSEYDTVAARLAAHVNHILMNRFRDTRVRGASDSGRHGPGELDSPVDARHVEHGIRVLVDGFEREGIRIDTDPDVYGVAVDINGKSALTAVLPRDELRYVTVAFARRPL